MTRMIDNMVADEDKGFADQRLMLFLSARMQINDINMQRQDQRMQTARHWFMN